MKQTAIQDAANYFAEQIRMSMQGLAAGHSSEEFYVFALEVADDFAAVFNAANTEAHFHRSSGGASSRWQPSQWVASGMDIDIEPLNELLDDPTYQPDPEKDKLRPMKQAMWLKAMVKGLQIAREEGELQWSGRPIAAFCSVQDSGLTGWFALESASSVNPPDLWKHIEGDFAKAWEGWETDDEALKVRLAFETL